MPKYTFLLPAYKGAFLREALQSILAQTYTDFKVLVSDDCSPEDLKTIVDEFASDPRLTYRRNAENMGGKSLVSHWNLLVDMCETEWLIMASDDDVYAPTFLEEVDKLQVKYPQVDVIRGRVQCIEEHGEVYAVDFPYEEWVCQEQYVYDHFTSQRNRCLGNHAFRTAELKRINGFVDYPFAWYSDDMAVFRMAVHGIAITRDVLFTFRSSGLNISGMMHSDSRNVAWIRSSVLYDRDIVRLVHSFKSSVSPFLCQKRKLWDIGQRDMMRGILVSYNYVLPFREMLRLYHEYKRSYLSSKYLSYVYIANWMRHFVVQKVPVLQVAKKIGVNRISAQCVVNERIAEKRGGKCVVLKPQPLIAGMAMRKVA